MGLKHYQMYSQAQGMIFPNRLQPFFPRQAPPTPPQFGVGTKRTEYVEVVKKDTHEEKVFSRVCRFFLLSLAEYSSVFMVRKMLSDTINCV